MMLFRSEGFQPKWVRAAFDKIMSQHDALRIIYRRQDEQFIQVNRKMQDELYTLQSYEMSTEADILSAANELQSSLDIHRGPLIKLGLFKTRDGDHLLIAIHHLLIDGVSWRIVLEDFEHAYQQVMDGQLVQLPEKTSSYQAWTDCLHSYASTSTLLKEKQYWLNMKGKELLPLPKNQEIMNRTWEKTQTISIQFTEAETDMLLKSAHQSYNTEPNDLLIAALGTTIQAFTGHDRVAVLMEGHGREDMFVELDITRTVGWFTTMYPVVLNLSRAQDMAYHIKQVKETLRSIPNKGIGYGVLKYLTEFEEEQDRNFVMSPEISFNYLGQFDGDIDKGLFVQSSLPSGSAVGSGNTRECALDVSGLVLDHKLTIHMTFHPEELGDVEIIKLLQNYRENLTAILTHCVEQEQTEATPSDLGHEDLSFEDLQTITEKIQISL